jgi:hypothetical protein
VAVAFVELGDVAAEPPIHDVGPVKLEHTTQFRTEPFGITVCDCHTS